MKERFVTVHIPLLRRHKLFFAIATVIALLPLAVVGLRGSRARADKAECRSKLREIALTIDNYRDFYGSLPPPSVADADGKPLHSWRVLLIPFLEKNWFMDEYVFEEPWDGPHNRRLHREFFIVEDSRRIDITKIHNWYTCPAAPPSQGKFCTNYVMVVDPNVGLASSTSLGTGYLSKQGWRETKRAGAELMIVEIHDSDIHWMEPRDLSVTEMSFMINDSRKPSISSLHVGGAFVILKDGTIEFLDEETTESRIREMVTRSVGK